MLFCMLHSIQSKDPLLAMLTQTLPRCPKFIVQTALAALPIKLTSYWLLHLAAVSSDCGHLLTSICFEHQFNRWTIHTY